MRGEILRRLLLAIGTYVPGEVLMQHCDISRQGVWKHIQALVEEGYDIISAKGFGYQLVCDPGHLSASRLDAILLETGLMDKAYYFRTIDSTNAFLKEHAHKVNTALALSEEQTHGRGRLGKSWESAAGQGLWFSLLQRPTLLPSQASMLTQVVALSMAQVLEDVLESQLYIKWPNDLMIDGKKVCGILTEMSAELHAIDYVVIGIGLNIEQQFSQLDLGKIATSLSRHTSKLPNRIELLTKFLKAYKVRYEQFLDCGNLSFMLDELNHRAYLNGREIVILRGEQKHYAKALHVDSQGELIVINEDGKREHLLFGEVSIRRTEDYATGI